MADGRITFSTKLDNSELEKDLKQTERKIERATKDIAKNEQAKLPLTKQVEELGAKLDEAKYKLDALQQKKRAYDAAKAGTDPNLAVDAFAGSKQNAADIKAQTREVDKLQKQFDRVADRVDEYDRKIAVGREELSKNTAEAKKLSATLSEKHFSLTPAIESAEKTLQKFNRRILTLGKRILIFSLAANAFRAIRDYMSGILAQNEEYNIQLQKMRGAMMTAFQPIYEYALPGILAVMKLITTAFNVVANILSLLGGKTAKDSAKAAQALNKESKAIKGVGKAVKEATKDLASFDEINRLSGDPATGGGGLDGLPGTKEPDFTAFDTDPYQKMVDKITLIMSGALLALGAILAFSGANIPLGIGLMAVGAIGLVSEIKGNPEGVAEMLQGPIGQVTALISGAFLVIGALLAFSGTNIPLGLALMALGAVGLAPVVALNWQKIQQELQGPLGKTLRLISSAVLVMGALLAFSGAQIPLGLALMAAGAAGIVATTNLDWNAMETALQGSVGAVMIVASGALLVLGMCLLFSGVGAGLGLGMMLAGGAGLATVAYANWDFITEKIKGAWESAKQYYNNHIAPVLTLDFWREKFNAIGDGLKEAFKGGINGAIEVANSFISWLNNRLSFNIPPVTIMGKRITDGGSIRLANIPNIPYLAQGAVIPPNAPFMAMLGDQRRGTNIEAPLETIQEAMALTMEDFIGGTMAGFERTVEMQDKILQAIMSINIGDETIGEAVKRYNLQESIMRGV